MTIFDELKRLVTPVPPSTQDEAWPVETSAYYEDTSVTAIYEPPILLDKWAPSVEQEIPLRGAMEHGVPADSSELNAVPVAPDVALEMAYAAQAPAIEDYEEVPPIPVVVVEQRAPISQPREFSTSRYTITDPALPTKIASPKTNRSRMRINTSAAVSIAPDPALLLPGLGYTLPAMESFELNTTQEVWALGVATVSVIEEFITEAGDNGIPVSG